MRWVRRLVGVALVAIVIAVGWWFPAANETAARVDYFWGTLERPLWMWLIGCFAGGFALAGTVGLWFDLRGKLVQRRYRKAVGRLESEIHELRNLPLSPDHDASGADPDAGDEAPRGSVSGGRGA